jgi:hypothetical protein
VVDAQVASTWTCLTRTSSIAGVALRSGHSLEKRPAAPASGLPSRFHRLGF